jgi:hypothetical protein
MRIFVIFIVETSLSENAVELLLEFVFRQGEPELQLPRIGLSKTAFAATLGRACVHRSRWPVEFATLGAVEQRRGHFLAAASLLDRP